MSSSSIAPIAANWQALATRLWWVSWTPFGSPVVPLEQRMAATSSCGSIVTFGGGPSLSSSAANGVAPGASPKTMTSRMPDCAAGSRARSSNSGDGEDRQLAPVSRRWRASLGDGESWVDRRGDAADGGDRVEGDGVLQRVGREDGEDVALAEATRRQPGRRPPDARRRVGRRSASGRSGRRSGPACRPAARRAARRTRSAGSPGSRLGIRAAKDHRRFSCRVARLSLPE